MPYLEIQQRLDDHRKPLPAANARRRQPIFLLPPLQTIMQRRSPLIAKCADTRIDVYGSEIKTLDGRGRSAAFKILQPVRETQLQRPAREGPQHGFADATRRETPTYETR